jgi:hypothetical protein
VSDVPQQERDMNESRKPPTAPEITRIIELMEQTDTDLFGVLEHLFLHSHFHLENDQILSWLPTALVTEAQQWLEEELKAQQDELQAQEDQEL